MQFAESFEITWTSNLKVLEKAHSSEHSRFLPSPFFLLALHKSQCIIMDLKPCERLPFPYLLSPRTTRDGDERYKYSLPSPPHRPWVQQYRYSSSQLDVSLPIAPGPVIRSFSLFPLHLRSFTPFIKLWVCERRSAIMRYQTLRFTMFYKEPKNESRHLQNAQAQGTSSPASSLRSPTSSVSLLARYSTSSLSNPQIRTEGDPRRG